MTLITRKFRIEGIDCDKCEKMVAGQAFLVPGVKGIDFYRKESLAEIETEEKVDLDLVFKRIQEKGYACEKVLENALEKKEEVNSNTLKPVAISEISSETLAAAPLALSAIVHKKFQIKNMVCSSCEKIISKTVHKLSGIKKVMIDYNSGSGEVSYDDKQTSFKEIKSKIEEKGYKVIDNDSPEEIKEKKKSWVSWILVGLGLILVGYFALQLYSKISLPQISQNMGYGLLFLVGLLTGFHCIAMCGGFVVSYTTKGVQQGKKPHQMHLSYAIGKTISYTVIGAIFGLLGSIIAFTPTMRGIAGILAGTFLVIFGIKMLGVPGLRKFRITLPRFLSRWIGEESKIHSQSPLVIGLLNGLMIACGPLQAMYIMAAGTGSMIEGAKILFIFALGTLPIMLSFGYITSLVSARATMKILKFSGIVVVILGLVMINRGLALTGNGISLDSFSSATLATNTAGPNIDGSGGIALENGYQTIRMTVDNSGFSPNKFVLQKGVPVKWIINGAQLNGCNSHIQVPAYDLDFEVKPGEQTIEFTPDKEGTISWSCWMGMLRGAFVVQDRVDETSANQALNTVSVPKGSTCGAGGGGCGCGGAR